MPARHFNNLLEAQWSQGHFTCVGLDSELSKIPPCAQHHTSQGTLDIAATLFSFNRAIVESTHDLVCAYKPNTAFYEAYGTEGIIALEQTISFIHEIAPQVPVILDAKRADIGNTNNGYVAAAFDFFKADAITLHPYLGQEALQPFLNRAEKGIIILCKTSNPGSGEFQNLLIDRPLTELAAGDAVQGASGAQRRSVHEVLDRVSTEATQQRAPEVELRMRSGEQLYQRVASRVAQHWNNNKNCGLVVGATYPEELKAVRDCVGTMPLLIPGIGAQGGSVEATVTAAKDAEGKGMIINSSRGIIFASAEKDFATAARRETEHLNLLIKRAKG